MAKGYVILTEAIHDDEAMGAYGAASMQPMIDHGGRPIVVDGDVEVVEGTWHGTRTVVVEFPSVEAAREWYRSDAYQSVIPMRQAAAACNVVIVAGFDMGAARA